jgi:hypothetical protein
MVRQNPTWGEAQVAWELALKLGHSRIATDRAGLLARRSQSASRSSFPALDVENSYSGAKSQRLL